MLMSPCALTLSEISLFISGTTGINLVWNEGTVIQSLLGAGLCIQHIAFSYLSLTTIGGIIIPTGRRENKAHRVNNFPQGTQSMECSLQSVWLQRLTVGSATHPSSMPGPASLWTVLTEQMSPLYTAKKELGLYLFSVDQLAFYNGFANLR